MHFLVVVELSLEDSGSKGIGDDSSLGRKLGITAMFGQLGSGSAGNDPGGAGVGRR